MMPGPDRVLACPACGQPRRQGTLASGNTFGGTLWSDGYGDYPMLPRSPSIARCPSCARLFWVDDAKEIGTFEPWSDEDSEWAKASYIRHLGAPDLEEALASGMGTAGRELELRTLLWWAHNDAVRQGGATPESPAFLDNLEGMRRLFLDGEDGVRLLRAETLREAGRFDEALREFETLFSPELKPYADAIGRAASVGDRRVFAFSDEG